MADKEKAKTIIELAQELPAGAVVVSRDLRKALKQQLAAVELVERRMAEARRDLTLGLAACEAAGDDVSATVTAALTAALALLPKELMRD